VCLWRDGDVAFIHSFMSFIHSCARATETDATTTTTGDTIHEDDDDDDDDAYDDDDEHDRADAVWGRSMREEYVGNDDARFSSWCSREAGRRRQRCGGGVTERWWW
jgi:hypothetical protein